MIFSTLALFSSAVVAGPIDKLACPLPKAVWDCLDQRVKKRYGYTAGPNPKHAQDFAICFKPYEKEHQECLKRENLLPE
jgi:hypothetical protein